MCICPPQARAARRGPASALLGPNYLLILNGLPSARESNDTPRREASSQQGVLRHRRRPRSPATSRSPWPRHFEDESALTLLALKPAGGSREVRLPLHAHLAPFVCPTERQVRLMHKRRGRPRGAERVESSAASSPCSQTKTFPLLLSRAILLEQSQAPKRPAQPVRSKRPSPRCRSPKTPWRTEFELFRLGNTGGMLDNIVVSRLYRPGSVAYVSRSSVSGLAPAACACPIPWHTSVLMYVHLGTPLIGAAKDAAGASASR